MKEEVIKDKDIYQQLAEVFGFGGSKLLAEIIKKVADSGEAEIMLAASPPATAIELAQKIGMPEIETGKTLESMYFRGLIQKSVKQDGVRYYRARHIIQFHDAIVSTTQRTLASTRYASHPSGCGCNA